jgi:hypothetical protein
MHKQTSAITAALQKTVNRMISTATSTRRYPVI